MVISRFIPMKKKKRKEKVIENAENHNYSIVLINAYIRRNAAKE